MHLIMLNRRENIESSHSSYLKQENLQLRLQSSLSPLWLLHNLTRNLPTFTCFSLAFPFPDHIYPVHGPPCRLFLLNPSLKQQEALKQASGLHQMFLTTSCSPCTACCNTPYFIRSSQEQASVPTLTNDPHSIYSIVSIRIRGKNK